MRAIVKYPSSKLSHAKHYPAPQYPIVVEPFAGGAGYSTYYEPKTAHLNDLDHRVAAAWRAAIRSDIASIPEIIIGERASEVVSGDAEWLVRSYGGGGFFQNKAQNWLPGFERVRSRLIEYQKQIAGWTITNGDYRDPPDIEATWFVDPPYISHKMSKLYAKNAINYYELAEWCKSRRGQVIVCEGPGAEWLPFEPLYEQKSKRKGNYGAAAFECVWVNG